VTNKSPHVGSTFESWLGEEGLREPAIGAGRAAEPAASIRVAIGFQAVAARLPVKADLGEAVERFLDRQPAVGVVHVVVDDQAMLLLRLARRRQQRQQQEVAQSEHAGGVWIDARIACVHRRELDRPSGTSRRGTPPPSSARPCNNRHQVRRAMDDLADLARRDVAQAHATSLEREAIRCRQCAYLAKTLM
jgi:hypothetical protein